MKSFSSVCFVTGAHMDLSGRLDGPPVAGASNPGRLIRRPGGVGLNTASVAAALGLEASLAGPVGEDADAGTLRAITAARGVSDALVVLDDARTGTFVSIIAPDGEMVIGLADLAIYEAVDAAWLAANCAGALEAADLWFLSANQTGATLAELAERAQGRLIAAATVSRAKAARLRPVLGRLDLLFANLAEARELTGLAGADGPALAAALAGAGANAGTISAAGGPVTWWDGTEQGTVAPLPVETIADVNGAGDALAGAVLAGLARGLQMPQTVRLAVAAAQLTLGVPQPFYEGLNWPLLEAKAAHALLPP